MASKIKVIVSQLELIGEGNNGKYIVRYDDGSVEFHDVADSKIPFDDRVKLLSILKQNEKILESSNSEHIASVEEDLFLPIYLN